MAGNDNDSSGTGGRWGSEKAATSAVVVVYERGRERYRLFSRDDDDDDDGGDGDDGEDDDGDDGCITFRSEVFTWL